MSSSALTTSEAQRQQALQQLQAAFGEPDGSMIFTYQGAVYQSVGVNSDGTLRLQNMATGQIDATVDPVDIFEASSTTPNTPPAPPPPPSQQPSLMATISSDFGMTATIIQLVTLWAGSLSGVATTLTTSGIAGVAANFGWLTATRAGLQALFTNPLFQATLGGLGAIFNGYSLYNSASAFWQKPSVSGGFGLALSSFGLAIGANTLIAGITSMVTGVSAATGGGALAGILAAVVPVWGWIAAAAIILAPLIVDGIKSLFGLGPSLNARALTNLNQALTPMIWTAGPLLTVGLGVVALLMGWPKGAQAPVMSQLTLPQSYVVSALSKPGSILGGSNVSASGPAVIVGADGNVIVETPAGVDSHGNTMMQLNSYVLSQNLQFVASGTPADGYIPFFIYQNGKPIPNPAVVKALAQQNGLLKSVLSGSLAPLEAQNAMLLASTSDKYGITSEN